MQEINATKRTDIYQIDPRNVDVVAGFNVRREFAIDELKEQIKLNGVLNPITVIPTKLPDGTERYRLVAAKAKYTKRLRAIEEYIASQQGNMFFDPANDEQLQKAQAKLKQAELDIEAAHERMRTKFNNIMSKQQ